MRKSGVIAAVAVAASLSTAAWACRCVPLTPAAAYRAADSVMLVTVTGSKDVDQYRRVYTVDVKRSWKGKAATGTSIATRRTTCMLDLAQGGEYLVYATHKTGGMPETTSCSGSKPVADAGEAIAWLGHHAKPAR